jgi:diguanylate cyclase (GGDEF)-like protein
MARFLRLNIENKMVFGYLPLFLFIIMIAVYPLITFNRVNKINESIVNNDVIFLETADKMVDDLLAQESYGHRYIILNNDEILNLFWQRSREFDVLITRIWNLPEQKDIPIKQLVSLHNEFNDLYEERIECIDDPSMPTDKEYNEIIKDKLNELIDLIKTTALQVKQKQKKKLIKAQEIGLQAFRVTAILAGIAILLGTGMASIIARGILRSISQLKFAIKEISEGRFNHPPNVKTQDELGELADAVREMVLRLAHLEKMCLDASPLTRLPGGIAIEEILKKRLQDGYPVAFCLLDLDNFKSFNDRYGYAKGNEIIRETAKIIETAVAKYGTINDFIGHIGGDDFALITTTGKYNAICNSIINEFDKKIVNFYDTEDLENGYIIGKTRQNQEMKFPIMTISIAVITNQDGKGRYSHVKFGEIAAELKEYAKSLSGSVCIVNRREEKA